MPNPVSQRILELDPLCLLPNVTPSSWILQLRASPSHFPWALLPHDFDRYQHKYIYGSPTLQVGRTSEKTDEVNRSSVEWRDPRGREWYKITVHAVRWYSGKKMRNSYAYRTHFVQCLQFEMHSLSTIALDTSGGFPESLCLHMQIFFFWLTSMYLHLCPAAIL